MTPSFLNIPQAPQARQQRQSLSRSSALDSFLVSAMGVPDDEIDHDLLDFMRAALLGRNAPAVVSKPKINVLRDAQFIVDNAIDVALSREHIVAAAEKIYGAMEAKEYSTSTWSTHELHPKERTAETANFIFTMDLLNFSFWSELDAAKRFAIEYRGKRWTGYWSIVAVLQRALDEGIYCRCGCEANISDQLTFPGIPITCPYFWVDSQICTDALLAHVFRSSTSEEVPLLPERIACLREAGGVLCEVCERTAMCS